MTAWQTTTQRNRRAMIVALFIALFACMSVANAFAQSNYSTSTPAGTEIKNSASVSYQDASANNYSAQSTSVSTFVQQIDGFVITPATYTLNGVANENVAIKYVITNYSNGSEKILLNVNGISGVDVVTSSSHLYQDNAGTPNSGAGDINNTSITIAQGGTYTFWWVGTMLSAADANNNKTFTVTGTDQGAPSIPSGATGNWTAPTLFGAATSTVTVNLTTGAVINLQKAMPTSGTGGSLPVTLTYSNPGSKTATAVWVVDYLPASTFTYTAAANVTWQGSTITPYTGTGGFASAPTTTVSGQTIQAVYFDGTTGHQIGAGITTPALAFLIQNVPFSASSTYTIQFPIATASGLLPNSYTNIAQFAYADSVNGTPSGTSASVDPCNTGTANTGNCLTTSATYTLNQSYSATLTPATQTYPSAVASGQSVSFNETVTNTGNGNDTIQLSTAIGTFPVGTTFTYYTFGGVTGLTPVTGSNGSVSATFASPLLAPGGTYQYTIIVTLPAGYTTGSAISFTPQATSKNGTGTLVTATDTISSVIQAVDILSGLMAGSYGTPTSGAATASNAGGLGTTVATIVNAPGINPSNAATNNNYVYELFIVNNGSTTDTFNVVASSSTSFSTTDSLNSGMSVSYYTSSTSDCSGTLTPVTFPVSVVAYNSTAANAKLVCAKLSVAQGFAAGANNVYFQASSATNSSNKDNVLDVLNVNAYYHVSVSSTTGSVNPGASVVYTNTITNDGNVAITTVSYNGTYVTDVAGGTPSGGVFSTTLYTDSLLTTKVVSGTTAASNLAVGASVPVYAQVNAALQDSVGQNDTTTITVTYTTAGPNQTASGTDTTNVVSAINNVVVTKIQTLDPACSGSSANWLPATPSSAAVQAKPGDCVVYQISVSNNTGSTVNNVQVSDQLNSYLQYCDHTAGTCGLAVAAGTWFNVGASVPSGSTNLSGTNVVSSPTLNQVTSGQSAPYFQFEVKIK